MKHHPTLLLPGSIFRSCAVAILFCLIAPNLHAQSPSLVYAKGLNNSVPLGGLVHTRAVAIDGSGNIYITGYFEFTADFNPGPGVANLTSIGSYNPDIFLAKYDASGNFIYAKSVSGTGTDRAYSLAVDASSNAYITGLFNGTANFNPTGTAVNLVSAGGSDVYLAKYDASGNLVYAKSVGGTGHDEGNALVLDGSSNVYLTGYFNGTVDFDPGAGTVNLVSAGNSDVFLSKYDASGNYIYAKQMGGTSTDIGFSIALDASNNAYITGGFQGTADFDPGAGTANFLSAGNNDIFLARYDASGNYVWAKKFGSASNDIGYGIALDASSNAYITGQFLATVDFNPGGTAANLTSAGNSDVFLARYDASGNYIYAKRMGGTSIDIGFSVAVDASNNAYIAGEFLGTADFDPGAATVNRVSAGSFDVFFGKYDASGNYVYANAIGSTGLDRVFAIKLDGSANLHIVGQFAETVDFDPGAGTVNLVGGASIENGFVLKLTNSAGYLWAGMQGTYSASSLQDYGRSIAVDASGNTYVTGYFAGTVDFDPGAGIVNLTSAGSNDIFIARYDASGNYVYAKSIGGTGDDVAYGVAIDASSNVYITGSFNGTADFDPGAAIVNHISGGNSDIFLARYDASGNYVWARKIGGTGIDVGRAIAVDGSSNVYITGEFGGTNIDFDPSGATANLSSAGGSDIFFGKYNASGIYVWARSIGGTSTDIGYAIAVNASFEVYITGYFWLTADFDPGAGAVSLTSAGSSDIFMAKYDASGNYAWAKRFGGTGADIGYAMALNASSDVHITGQFQTTADFNPGGTAAILTSAGSNDIFLAKYDASGNYVYANRMGGTGSDIAYGIAVDGSSSAYITGQFANTVDFDPGAGTASFGSAGGFDIFLAKYDVLGNHTCSRASGSINFDVGYSVAVSTNANIYITGTFAYTVDFYPEGGSSTSILTANNDINVFVAAYNNFITVPLRFESIAARLVQNGEAVQIDWSAAAQVNNDYFEVQRSKDGVDFEQVSRVSGCLSCNSAQQYTAIDHHPFTGPSFYRIKQVDTDGKASYSTTVRVSLGKRPLTSLTLYPTITHNAFSVRVQNKGVQTSALMQIWSAEGKLAQQQTIWLRKGDNRFSYSLAGEVRGVYYVRLVSSLEQTSLSANIIRQ